MTGAVSWLFVPGDRPDRFAKAAGAGADEVIVDLEDAVTPEAKPGARDHAARWLAGGGTAWVRVNATGTRWHDDDLAAVAGCRGLRGVLVPKAEHPAALTRIARRLSEGAGIVALVETARGLRDAASIAACDAVCALAFGSVDFALDIGADHTDEALLFARCALVVAARAANLPGPLDGVTTEIKATEVVARDAARSRGLGFGGKLCIHPAQVAAVMAAFAPSEADLDGARTVLARAAAGDGVFVVDGHLVDKPVVERARRIVALGERR